MAHIKSQTNWSQIIITHQIRKKVDVFLIILDLGFCGLFVGIFKVKNGKRERKEEESRKNNNKKGVFRVPARWHCRTGWPTASGTPSEKMMEIGERRELLVRK